MRKGGERLEFLEGRVACLLFVKELIQVRNATYQANTAFRRENPWPAFFEKVWQMVEGDPVGRVDATVRAAFHHGNPSN